MVCLDGPQSLPYALASLPQQLEGVAGRTLRGGTLWVSPVFLDEVSLEGCRDFVGRLQGVVDGPVPRGVVNHVASIADRSPGASARKVAAPECGCQHMLTLMEPALDIARRAASTDPDVGLRAVASLRALAERLEIPQVENARKPEWSWQDIAGRPGVTRQTVRRNRGKRAGSR